MIYQARVSGSHFVSGLYNIEASNVRVAAGRAVDMFEEERKESFSLLKPPRTYTIEIRR